MPRPVIPRVRGRQACLAQGLAYYRQGYWWEAHEAWEALWVDLGRRTPEARLVQSLILLSASLLKAWCGQPPGSRRLAQRALSRAEEALMGLGADTSNVGLAPDAVGNAIRQWLATPLPPAEHAAVQAAAPRLPPLRMRPGGGPDGC